MKKNNLTDEMAATLVRTFLCWAGYITALVLELPRNIGDGRRARIPCTDCLCQIAWPSNITIIIITIHFLVILFCFRFSNLFVLLYFHLFTGCYPTQYQCPNNCQCISLNSRCNGYNDCGDNSDETSCSCECHHEISYFSFVNTHSYKVFATRKEPRGTPQKKICNNSGV